MDLEDSMKKLLLAPPSANEGNGFCQRMEPLSSRDQIDDFLREALWNPRDRLFILKLEQEVDRFMRSPDLKQMEFQPMPSSYLRLAAHRVAQHYKLQSTVADCNLPEGARVVAFKTPESGFPALRLADLLADVTGFEDAADHPRLVIMQRPPKDSRQNEDIDTAAWRNSSKSVEERKEEYDKARARIFNGRSSSPNAVLFERQPSVESFPGLEEESLDGQDLVSSRGVGGGDDGFNSKASGIQSDMGGNNFVRDPLAAGTKFEANCVAIFRDREKDLRDPDYNRSYDRYTQRFEPGFGLNPGLYYNMQGVYAPPPMANYNTEFPNIGGVGRTQVRPEMPFLHLAQVHGGGPWFNSSSSMGYGPIDSMTGPFNPGPIGGPPSLSYPGVYVHAPTFACPGPAMTYLYPPDHFHKSLSQPCSQPEARSLGQALHQ